MTIAPADYSDLAPIGFTAIHTALNDLESFVHASAELKRSGLLAQASKVSDGASLSPFTLVTNASVAIGDLAQIPISNFRDASAYAKLVALLLPTGKDAKGLATLLNTVIKNWKPVDTEGIISTSKVASEALQQVYLPFIQTYGKFKGIQRQMDIISKLLKSGKVPPVTDLSNRSVLEVLAQCAESVTGKLDTTNPVDQRTLLDFVDLKADIKNLARTFPELAEKSPEEADGILASLITFSETLTLMIQSCTQAQSSVRAICDDLTSAAAAIGDVRLGIDKFSGSAEEAPNDYKEICMEVVKAWNITEEMLQEYISFVVGGMTTAHVQHSTVKLSAIQKTGFAVGDSSEDSNETPEKVNEAFGPPSYVETVLADMGPQSGKVMEALSNFLQLPFVNELQVQNNQGADVSVREQVVGLRDRYQTLQSKTIPVTRAISSYGLISEALLPKVNQEGGITLDKFLETNFLIVKTHGQKAREIAEQTRAVKGEFKDFLAILEKNLVEINKKMKELEKALEEAESEYKKKWISALVSGIITLAFTTAAIVALCLGAGPVAAELGVHAAVSLVEMIKEAIDAGQLAKLISNLKSMISACEKTKSQLEIAIPLFGDIVSMIDKIGDAWDSINENLIDIQNDYSAWSNPKLFTPEYLELTLGSWRTVRAAIGNYVDVINGGSPANTNVAIAQRVFLRSSIQTTTDFSFETHKDSANTMVFAAKKANLAVQSILTQNAASFFEAPQIRGPPVSQQDLVQLVNEWGEMGSVLSGAGETNLANECNSVAQTLQTQVIPSVTQVIGILLDFARKQPEVPTLPVSEETWHAFYNSRITVLSDGKTKANIVDTTLRNVQNQALNIQSFTQARLGELQGRIAQLQDEERRIQHDIEERRAQWGPIVEAIRELFDQLRGVQDQRYGLENEMRRVAQLRDIVSGAGSRLGQLFNTTSGISTFWADITTETQVAADLWEPLNELRDVEIQLYKRSWDLVIDNFRSWA